VQLGNERKAAVRCTSPSLRMTNGEENEFCSDLHLDIQAKHPVYALPSLPAQGVILQKNQVVSKGFSLVKTEKMHETD
jgi:hypothetical protein